jgi:hypothetical protein
MFAEEFFAVRFPTQDMTYPDPWSRWTLWEIGELNVK